MNDARVIAYATGYAVVALAFIIAMPILTIWSLNTLFKLGIDYNLMTWLAVFWLIRLQAVGRRVLKDAGVEIRAKLQR